MVKVKVMKFRITHFCGSAEKTYAWQENREKADDTYPLYSESKITEVINKFLTDNKATDVISIIPSVVCVKCHNNGGCNTNELYYTITYKC